MPITVPIDLPASSTLEKENIFVMDEERAVHQDIRPLRILILNLMPTKIETETQLLRLLSNSPLQINVELLHMNSHVTKNVPKIYLQRFYRTFNDIRDSKYDGLIITGAPIETLPFEKVDYWNELTEIMDWSVSNVYSTLHICWGAQAGLYHHYNIPKHKLKKKLSGVYRHNAVSENEPLLRGFDDEFWIPHSRNTEVRAIDINKNPHLHILAISKESGVAIVTDEKAKQVFITGHLEYDPRTLAYEYDRDTEKGLAPEIPRNYFPNDDPRMQPLVLWRGHANLLFANWLNYYVYQQTPFDISRVGPIKE